MIAIIVIIFVVGYLAIAFEHSIKINKAASALLTGVICWSIYALWGGDKELISEDLAHHLSEIAGILFFLLGHSGKDEHEKGLLFSESCIKKN